MLHVWNAYSNAGTARASTTSGIRHLLFTGIATNVCVESTARSAFFNDFWPILVEDPMNHSGPDFSRQATLWNFEHVFGWVTNAARTIEALQTTINLPSSSDH